MGRKIFLTQIFLTRFRFMGSHHGPKAAPWDHELPHRLRAEHRWEVWQLGISSVFRPESVWGFMERIHASQLPRFQPLNPLWGTAALKPPQSRRFAPHGDLAGARQRLDCGWLQHRF